VDASDVANSFHHYLREIPRSVGFFPIFTRASAQLQIRLYIISTKAKRSPENPKRASIFADPYKGGNSHESVEGAILAIPFVR
jgi:hypothetical protein